MTRCQDKTTFQVGASVLVRALWQRAVAVGRERRGVYDLNDPTAYVKVCCVLNYQHDPWLMRDYWDHYVPSPDDLEDGPPNWWRNQPAPAACYTLQMSNVTWGVEVRLTFSDSEVDSLRQRVYLRKLQQEKPPAGRGINMVLRFYLDFHTGEIQWTVPGEMHWIQEFLLDAITAEGAAFQAEPALYAKDMVDEAS